MKTLKDSAPGHSVLVVRWKGSFKNQQLKNDIESGILKARLRTIGAVSPYFFSF